MVTQRTETVVLLLTRELERTKTLRNWLDAAHFTTITAVPGDVGVARAEAEQPDAIVLYVTGPGPEAQARCLCRRVAGLSGGQAEVLPYDARPACSARGCAAAGARSRSNSDRGGRRI